MKTRRAALLTAAVAAVLAAGTTASPSSSQSPACHGGQPSGDCPDGHNGNTISTFQPRALSNPQCFAALPSAPFVVTDEIVDVPVYYGPSQPMTLRMQLYLPGAPKDVPGCPDAETYRAPTILIHGFYNGVFGDWIVNWRYRDFADHFVRRGYAVALSDVRGTGMSGGCLELDGPNQARDVGTLVKYIVGQPWSNGKVGGFGVSGDAEALNAGVTAGPPAALETIVTVAGLSGLYEFGYFDGVPYAGRVASNAVAFLPFGFYPPVSNPSVAEATADRPRCWAENIVASLDLSGDMTPYYQEREFRLRVGSVPASVLYVQGLHDTSVLPSNIHGWLDQLPTFHRAVIGQWEHVRPDEAGELGRPDFLAMLGAWYDYFLLDLPTGVESWPPVQVQDEHRMWRSVPSYAEMGTPSEYALGSGVLGEAASPGTTVTFSERSPGTWVSAPLDGPLHISGEATLDARIALDRDDAHFALELSELFADGNSRTLTRGYRSARHRASLIEPLSVPVDEPVDYTIRTLPLDAWLASGSRLQLVLGGFDGPRGSLRNPVPAGNDFTARIAADGSSVLRLPVVTRYDCLRVAQTTPPASVVPGCEAALEPLL